MGVSEAKTETGQRMARLAEEQAALRRVATLVARGVPRQELFRATCDEVRHVLRVDLSSVGRYHLPDSVEVLGRSGEGVSDELGEIPLLAGTVPTLVARTGQAARRDDFLGAVGPLAEWAGGSPLSVVGVPVLVAGELWGVMTVATRGAQALPADTEDRLASFTELLATAIANVESLEQRTRLLEEQSALRRVATLAASGAGPEALLRATVDEVQRVLNVDLAAISRYELPERVAVLYRSGFQTAEETIEMPLGGQNVATLVAETGRPARLDDYANASGPLAEWARREGVCSIVGAPVIVDGRLWGVMSVAKRGSGALPAETEERLGSFNELLGTAMANIESRQQLTFLVGEQSALRRLATLIATGAAHNELLFATADEVREVMEVDFAAISRYLPGDKIMTVHWSGDIEFPSEDGEINPLGGKNVATIVARTGETARIDSYADADGAIGEKVRASVLGSIVGVPVHVDGRLWGVITAGVTKEKPPLPSDAEMRLEAFTKLLATGVANAESRAELTASRSRVVAAADESRRRIERDLHDGVQQRIISLALEVQEAQTRLPRRSLAHIVDGLDEIQDQLREITSGLHPAMLAEGGIELALGTLARRAPLPVYLDISLNAEPPESVAVAVYFIVSELLTNAAKHAQASSVHVTLQTTAGVLRLDVRDDGVGGADLSGGTGLLGLSDRVKAMGGVIHLDSPSGAGTLVWIELPLDSAATGRPA